MIWINVRNDKFAVISVQPEYYEQLKTIVVAFAKQQCLRNPLLSEISGKMSIEVERAGKVKMIGMDEIIYDQEGNPRHGNPRHGNQFRLCCQNRGGLIRDDVKKFIDLLNLMYPDLKVYLDS